MKLEIKSEVEESVNTNQVMSFKERRKSDLIERKKNNELAKDGKKNIEKKANKIKEIFEGKTKKHVSFMQERMLLRMFFIQSILCKIVLLFLCCRIIRM